MFAVVVAVERAEHVLGVLDVLWPERLLWAGHGEEQVARAGLANGGWRQATVDVVVMNRVEVDALEAEVKEADGWITLAGGVEFDELIVVNLDEGLVRDVILSQIEGLLEAELLVERHGGREIVHADGDVGDSVKRRRRLCAKAENVQESQRKGEEAGGAASRDHHVIHYIGRNREAGKIGGVAKSGRRVECCPVWRQGSGGPPPLLRAAE